MKRLSAALAAAAALAGAVPAAAHNVSPNYLSRIDRVTPGGVTLSVINRADQLELTNRSGKEVVVEGYNDDPYARIEPDGTVQVNTQSPAYYLNDDYYANAIVPKGVTGAGAPQWKTLDKTGHFAWHDHRIHWMSRSTPPQVKNQGVKTKIFDWKVPISVGGTPGTVAGTLYWIPDAKTPTGFIVVGSVLVLALCAAALIARRRRDRAAVPDEAW